MAAKQPLLSDPDTVGNRAPQTRGTIRHLYPERGFGFIRCTEGLPSDVGQDFFFHQSGLDDLTFAELLPGSKVEFTATDVPRGKRAEHVRLAD